MSQQTDFESSATARAVRQVAAAVAASDYQRAFEIAQGALSEGAAHPVLFNARAMWLERQKRDEEALADFERAASLTPKNAPILNAIGLCLIRLHRPQDAASAFDEAIRVDPTYLPSYHRKGIALGMAGDTAGAQRAHERAVLLNPRSTEALANLAAITARKGDTKKALDYAQRALKLDPHQPTATAALAVLDNAEGRFAEAEQRLRAMMDRPGLAGHGRAVVLGLLADALDGQDRVADAFAAYSSENEELRLLHAPRFSGMRGATDLTKDLVAHFQTAPREPEHAKEDGSVAAGQPLEHVFVLGFYRSGTTLLRQVLASHPDILTLEERDFLLRPAADYLSSPQGLVRLSAITDDELAAARADYWRQVKDHGLAVSGKVFVDKHPLNTIKLPLIAKLFPRAKIVLALRDPRDVVLSCFRRHFEVDAAMFELLTLESTAEFYDAVMQLTELMRERVALPFFTHRYEDMVADFDGRIRALCEFLGVPFNDAMRDFHAKASARDIRSPSATQVTRELYDESVGQWRRYRAQLAPVFPILEPWAKKFGYPLD